jgi:hypothetical protein
LWHWDKEVLGNFKLRIKKARRELERCGRAPISQEVVSKENILKYKLSRPEDRHSMNQQQETHANWLNMETVTQNFHVFASERSKTNVINILKREGGGVERENE